MRRSSFIKSLVGLSAAGVLGSYSVDELNRISALDEVSFGNDNGNIDFRRVREHFPRVENEIYMDNASTHPINIFTAAALHRYTEWAKNEVGEPWWPDWAESRNECKAQFARLINAAPSEISFARTTVEAENNLVNGLDLRNKNVVTNDLHYSASLYSYLVRQERSGLDVRIVKCKDWQFDVEAIAEKVDRNTGLIAITLVSNVNGFLTRDIKAISDLAHAHGAYLYVDLIQGVGAVPVDVKAMGIDMAAASTFKWMMGSKGLAFQYVREDLQGSVIKPTQLSGGVRFNYSPWTPDQDPDQPDIVFRSPSGPGMYEVSYPSYEGVICAQASLKYIEKLGVENIQRHNATLIYKLRKEMPRLGYLCITPEGNRSPIISFEIPNPRETMEKLRAANIHVAMRFGNKMRISPSVFTDMNDIERFLEVMS